MLFLLKCWKHLTCIWLTCFIRITCYPSLLFDIQPLGNLKLPASLWAPVAVFQLFATFIMLGSISASFITAPGPRYYWIPVVTQLLFIPYFVMCNYLPNQRHPLPVIISNDYAYLSGTILYSFMSGYFASLSLMFIPKYASSF